MCPVDEWGLADKHGHLNVYQKTMMIKYNCPYRGKYSVDISDIGGCETRIQYSSKSPIDDLR